MQTPPLLLLVGLAAPILKEITHEINIWPE